MQILLIRSVSDEFPFLSGSISVSLELKISPPAELCSHAVLSADSSVREEDGGPVHV